MAGQWIAVDFDHTIRDTGFTDEPLPGARDAMALIHENGHKIMIFSCNDKDHIEQWMRNHDIWFDAIWDGKGKVVAAAYIDDRGVAFRGDWQQSVEEALALVEGRPVRRY
jgi:hypothetical protein